MKKIFVAYRFTGEDLDILQRNLDQIKRALEARGLEAHCTIADEQSYRALNLTVKQILDNALQQLDACDLVFAFVNSASRSEGMLIELGYAFAKSKPIILAARKGVNVHSSTAVAHRIIEFDSMNNLMEQISKLEF